MVCQDKPDKEKAQHKAKQQDHRQNSQDQDIPGKELQCCMEIVSFCQLLTVFPCFLEASRL